MAFQYVSPWKGVYMNLPASEGETREQELFFSEPMSELGYQVAELVKSCPPLDSNSTYCNLLQCEHFSSTSCAIVTNTKALVGFVSAYLLPQKPDTLFIWQVAVDASQRGKNLGMKMILHILSRDICRDVKYLETTVTDSNAASSRMFVKLAQKLQTPEIEKSVLFDRQKHFQGLHDSEVLYSIGPFNQPSQSI